MESFSCVTVYPHPRQEVKPLGAADGRGQPDLLVWGLFVDDVGAKRPQLEGQHTALATMT